MARKIIDVGVVGNDGTGDSIRDSFRKVNDNFRELYSSLGLGENLTFIALDDTPATYVGQNDPVSGSTPLLTVNNTESGIAFKQLVPGTGIAIDYTTNANEIIINSEFSAISGDTAPRLGGDLRARSGGEQFRILELPPYNFLANPPGGPTLPEEATSKAYVDTKISRAGVDGIDPETLQTNSTFGTMTGPLILSRNPIAEDDLVYDGLIAATKNYVDRAGFGSVVNLYVATSGQDDRPGLGPELQGRALAFAYRTIESALSRAEEIINDALPEIGPYKKTLTYNNGANTVVLERIDVAPGSGSGFSGAALLSVDTAVLSSVGVNYNIGDRLTVVGGTFVEPARFQVLTTASTPGAVVTFRTLSTGVYSALPGTVIGSQRIVTLSATNATGGPTFGAGVEMSLTFNVANIQVLAGGTGFSLVSVRVVGGGGLGAFGTADIEGGVIQGITVTDSGSGFVNLPNVVVNLPRFLLKTEFQRTDFTGDVTTQTAAAARGRDIREGLFLRGETSGALAQILAHSGALDSEGNEIFDVDIKFGNFRDTATFGEGEAISYGDQANQTQISVLVESGIYEENYPLRVPQNTSIVGDEFRRVIVRPRPGISSSPWAFLHFRRDLQIDGLATASQLYGYHYLQDPSQPVYPLINNRGFYRSSSELLRLNRSFLREQVVNWIDDQIVSAVAPYNLGFIYDRPFFISNVGLILDSMVYDLEYGGSDRTVSSALKYRGTVTGVTAITTQLSQTVAGIQRLNTLAQFVVKNIAITELYNVLSPQIIDGAFTAEANTVGATVSISNISRANPCVITTGTAHGLANGDEVLISSAVGLTELNGNNFYVNVINATSFGISEFVDLSVLVNSTTFGTYTSGGVVTVPGGIITALTNAVIDVISNSNSVNYPKENNEMDVFLANDTVRWQAMTAQGHGGFMLVLDPAGQILAKSPYAQECACFSRSTGVQTFAGGMFVDGFTGNIKFKLLVRDSSTFLRVGDLARYPQLPASFIVQDEVYRINYVRDFVYNVTPGSPTATSTASFVLDETTPWPFEPVVYDSAICNRDVGLIIDGLGFDIVLTTNYHARKAGLSYRQANSAVVITDQLDITARAVLYAHEEAESVVVGISASAAATVVSSGLVITNIIRNGATFAPSLLLTNPAAVDANTANAKSLLLNNVEYIKAETIGYVNAQIAANTAPYSTSFTYNQTAYAREIQYDIEALIYDLLYGGNSQTRDAARRYYDGVGDAIAFQLPAGTQAQVAAANDYAKDLAKLVIQNLPPAVSYSTRTRATGTPASGTEVAQIETLMSAINLVILTGVGSLAAITLPDLNAYVYAPALKNSKTALDSGKAAIQSETLAWIDDNINVFEVLMPGNRSMLSNDFTQINDMGYGLLATNGGLTESVSMFTYYCYVSYYALNGAQIRSIGGSSAQGVYALVAEGSDPLEVPTPVNLYHDLSQGAVCYFPSSLFANLADGLEIFVTGYTHTPLPNGELEIDHGYVLFRYTIRQVATETLPVGVSRLTLASSDGDGLFAAVPDGTRLTIRQLSTIALTGDIVEVVTRPSTGLVLVESPTVYRVLQFDAYVDPAGAQICTISNSSPTEITRTAHQLEPNYQLVFSTTGTLPLGITVNLVYFVLADNYTEDSFQVSLTKNGIAVATTTAGSGVHRYTVFGLARTTLRENYDYVDLRVWPEQPYAAAELVCTITVANPAVVTTAAPHGLVNGDVIRFRTSGGGSLPGGLSSTGHFFVGNVIDSLTFTVDREIGLSTPVETVTAGTGTFFVQQVVARVGDDEFAVVPVGPGDAARILQTKFVFLAREYTVVGYDNETTTNEPYALLRISPALQDSVTQYNDLPTLKSGVAKGEVGTLTIRISLTRVTSHDLLDIGTGSYADTNYPNEIFGAPVNAINASYETEERTVGRVFYVTTDQFGNFNVGPFFRVDQGTGTVTFSAAIALSNLDGLGFKRGVPVSEFSTDSSFSDNATDTVPTENATRTYLERRLGLSHSGAVVIPGSLIPAFSGGYMALDGQLSMKADMNLASNKIINISDPTQAQDAVNLRSLTFANFQDFTGASVSADDLLVFTGVGNSVINAEVVGDISLAIDIITNTIEAQINPGVIVNNDVNAAAAIAQSKLAMTVATTRAAPAGIAQVDRGLASFDDARFVITDGWVTLRTNGAPLTAIAQIPTDTVLGNSTSVTANVTAVTFATVVDEGKALKKSNFTSVGFIRRKNAVSFDGDTGSNLTDSYEIIDADASNTASTLVRRDSSGDFAARVISGDQFKIDARLLADSTTSGGGGVIQLYSYLGQGAILLGDGSLATDKRNFYDNEGHIFRPQNGVGNAPITCSTINASAITGTGSPTTTMTGQFRLAAGSTLHATYADLAEYYQGDRHYETGTVLVFGGDQEVTASATQSDHRAAGVVSAAAALVMNEGCDGIRVLVALQGRVPCRVVGKISKGDLLVTSNITGVAISAGSAAQAGTIIGKALRNYDSDHIGMIEVAVGRA